MATIVTRDRFGSTIRWLKNVASITIATGNKLNMFQAID